MRAFVLASALLAITNALRCYQGQQNGSIPVIGQPMECLHGSSSCILTLDMDTNTVTRACQTSNCTLNGGLTAVPTCTNRSSTPWPGGTFTTHCCCYGDGCNVDQKTMTYVYPPFLSAERKLANAIAHRIEVFYDRDAVSAERTFIRRVFNHVYQHIVRVSKGTD